MRMLFLLFIQLTNGLTYLNLGDYQYFHIGTNMHTVNLFPLNGLAMSSSSDPGPPPWKVANTSDYQHIITVIIILFWLSLVPCTLDIYCGCFGTCNTVYIISIHCLPSQRWLGSPNHFYIQCICLFIIPMRLTMHVSRKASLFLMNERKFHVATSYCERLPAHSPLHYYWLSEWLAQFRGVSLCKWYTLLVSLPLLSWPLLQRNSDK